MPTAGKPRLRSVACVIEFAHLAFFGTSISRKLRSVSRNLIVKVVGRLEFPLLFNNILR